MPRPSPPGWPRLSAALNYEDPAAAIAWLERAFGFETRIKVEGPNGEIYHSELTYGEAVVMVSGLSDHEGKPRPGSASPRGLGGKSTASLLLYVDDADAHCAHARAAGATIVKEPTTSDYGEGYWTDRGYGAADCEGHSWYFAQRIRENT